MINLQEALERITATLPLPVPSTVSLADAVGYVLAEDIVSPIDVYPFRNSAMDGFAIRADLLADCSPESPITLPVAKTIFAGSTDVTAGDPKSVVKIMTGARVPEPYDAVVRVEDCRFDDQAATFVTAPKKGMFIRPPGEDIKKGRQLLTAGHRLGALDIGVLASIGLADIPVYRKPRVLLLVTGDELQPVGEPLQPGNVYDANSHTVAALIRPFTADLEIVSPFGDHEEEMRRVFQSETYDVFIVTGGVSMGDRDWVPEAAMAAGWNKVFHKVAIKPGKPGFFATRQQQLFFGLPGNPLSVAVTCALYVVPSLRRMAGDFSVNLMPQPARLSGERRRADRLLVWPGSIREVDGVCVAELAQAESSAVLSAIVGSDGLILVETDAPNPQAVHVLPWSQLFGDIQIIGSQA